MSQPSFHPVPLPPSSSCLYLEIPSPYSVSVISNCYFSPTPPHRFLLYLRRLSFVPCFSNGAPLFKQFSRGRPNPSFSTSVHAPFQESSEETVTKHVCRYQVEFRILFRSSLLLQKGSLHWNTNMKTQLHEATYIFGGEGERGGGFFSMTTPRTFRRYMNAFGLT